jgi:hypothetical protein
VGEYCSHLHRRIIGDYNDRPYLGSSQSRRENTGKEELRPQCLIKNERECFHTPFLFGLRLEEINSPDEYVVARYSR